MLRKLALILILEVLVAANAGFSFQLFPRFVAGLWAGSCFVALGLFILHYLYHWNFKSRSVLFWLAMVHTFVFSIPMLAARLTTPSDESVSNVLFVPIQYFHKTSTWAFLLMGLATLIEVIREIIRMKKKKPTI